jgi:hypothetical protein
MPTTTRLLRSVAFLLLAGTLLFAVGCGSSTEVKTTSVSGTATLDKKPLTVGQLMFFPDVAKGNPSNLRCGATLGSEGQYELAEVGRPPKDKQHGIPVGWYKVAFFPPKNAAAPTVNPKYLSLETTPLSIEVVENPEPGHYDIPLTSD